MILCFVSVGSNVDRERNVRNALQALRNHFGPLIISSVYETPAVGFTGAPFYNLVVGLASDRSPAQIAVLLREIEAKQGRQRDGVRFGPRTLDLDLLLYGNAILTEGNLKLPRGEIVEHSFVLEPLAEIAPDLIHPVAGRSYKKLWDGFSRPSTRTTTVNINVDETL